MTAFPRSILPAASTDLVGPVAFASVGQTGKIQRRATAAAGWSWTERWAPLPMDSDATHALLAFIRQQAMTGGTFTVQHQRRLTPRGGGSGSVTANGANQTGSSIVTAGWGGTNPVLRAGDLVQLPGITRVFEVTADVTRSSGAATIPINPSVFAGGSPTNGGAVVYSGVSFTAMILAVDGLAAAQMDPAGFLEGLAVTFVEAP